ncbi:MAG: phage tail protein [Bacteroidetes bacterium]|nr:phage tail protein [Bacteroidota bacterium]
MDLGLTYPAPGFHFLVAFELFPQRDIDVRFQEVSGLTVNVQTEEIREGGENRFTHKLPIRTNYSDIVLKRGLFTFSGVIEWCRDAVENFNFKPTNVLISLMNDSHVPLNSWYVVNAIPIKWEVSSFNAEQSSAVIETLTLSYRYYKVINPASLISDLSGAVGGALGI